MIERQQIIVFSKQWRDCTTLELAATIRSLGFDGLELTVRDGYQVTPVSVEGELENAARILRDQGLEIHSVASELTEPVFAGCARAGVPLIRIQVPVSVEDGYFISRDRFRSELDDLQPIFERYGVAVAVQIHSGRFLSSSVEVMDAIRDYDPRYVTIVWDVGHAAIVYEDAEYGLSTCADHLSLINFKNFRYERDESGAYSRVNCTGEQGIGSWKDAVLAMHNAGYAGACCISAQYGPGDETEECAKRDCAYLRELIDSLPAEKG